MSIAVRSACPGDLDRLVRIEHAVFAGDRLSRRSLHRLLGRASSEIRLVERAGVVAGYALLLFRKGSRVARLYSIAVDPRFAGSGIGRVLLDDSARRAVARGCGTMRLEVRQDNARAIELYRRSGFRPIGRSNGYYEDGTVALRFERPLDHGFAAVGGSGADR